MLECFFNDKSSMVNQNASRAPGAHSPPLVMVSVSLPLTQGPVDVHYILNCKSFLQFQSVE